MKLNNKATAAKHETFMHMPPTHVGMRLKATVEDLIKADDKDASTSEGEEQVNINFKWRMVWYMFIK